MNVNVLHVWECILWFAGNVGSDFPLRLKVLIFMPISFSCVPELAWCSETILFSLVNGAGSGSSFIIRNYCLLFSWSPHLRSPNVFFLAGFDDYHRLLINKRLIF